MAAAAVKTVKSVALKDEEVSKLIILRLLKVQLLLCFRWKIKKCKTSWHFWWTELW